jgi:3-oxoacyl-[acyl-carrier protein] reductase
LKEENQQRNLHLFQMKILIGKEIWVNKTLLGAISQNNYPLDILVHNAGITRDKTLAKMDIKYWDQVLNVNLQAILNINDALLPSLNEGGRVIAMSSISGLSGNFGQANYAATKAALIGYVAALAPELSSRGITVNAIAPGFIETAMTAKMPLMTREGGRRLSNLQQGGLPEDIAEATLFLTSPGAAGITGQTLRVCGGSMIGA